MFLQDNPIGPGDRVLAGLSVAFDASCEEMWLAWRHGACLVPAPRSLVRSGMDLGPWLVSRDITVVSTVPTLAALWPAEALEAVRLLIFGGEACPPELAERLAVEGREVWNTYGPTEATVVACAARLDGTGPVSIGLPLRGWDLAVVDKEARPVSNWRSRRTRHRRRGPGPLPGSGQGRRKVRRDADARMVTRLPQRRLGAAGTRRPVLRRPGRRPGQGRRPPHRARRGGRRLGEPARVSAAALPRCDGPPAALPCWSAISRAPTRRSTSPRPAPRWPSRCPRRWCRGLCFSTSCPRARRARSTATRCPGRSRANGATEEEPDLGGTMGWLAGLWRDVLAAPVDGPEADFHALGGGSLSAAQLVAAMRQRYPQVTVADLYDHPRLGSLAGYLDELDPPPAVEARVVKPTPRLTQARAGGAVAAACHADRAAVGGVARAAQQCCRKRYRSTTSDALAGAGQLVVDRRRLPAVHQPAGPHVHRGVERADSAWRP